MIIKLEYYNAHNYKENRPARRHVYVSGDCEQTGMVVLGVDIDDTDTQEEWSLSPDEAYELGAALKFWAGHQERKFR